MHISDLLGTEYAATDVTFGVVVEGAAWLDRFERIGPDGVPISFAGTTAAFVAKTKPDGDTVGTWTATTDATGITVTGSGTANSVPAGAIWRDLYVELRVTLADNRQVVAVGTPSILRVKAAV